MPIVRMGPPAHPMTRQRKKRPGITISTNAEIATLKKRVRLANSASLFSLKDRFTASDCVT